MNVLVTGGAGFIGGNFVYHMLGAHPDYKIICVDCLTYAGNMSTLEEAMKKETAIKNIESAAEKYAKSCGF